MIISLILNPSVMNGESFQTISGYRENVHTLFKGLAANGVLLDDSHGTLQRELRQSIESLPPKYRQRLQGCFEELVKNKKQRIIKMPAQATRGGVRGTMTRLNELHPVDALCVSEQTLQSLGEPPRMPCLWWNMPTARWNPSGKGTWRRCPPCTSFPCGKWWTCGPGPCVTASGCAFTTSKLAKART